jgi:hypothetical protein
VPYFDPIAKKRKSVNTGFESPHLRLVVNSDPEKRKSGNPENFPGNRPFSPENDSLIRNPEIGNFLYTHNSGFRKIKPPGSGGNPIFLFLWLVLKRKIYTNE